MGQTSSRRERTEETPKGLRRPCLVESAESTVTSEKRSLFAATLLDGELARLPGASEGAAMRKPEQGRRRAAQVQAAWKDGGGTVVIETGPTVVLEGPYEPYDPNNDSLLELGAPATCTNGVAVGCGVQTVRPTPRISIIRQNSEPYSPVAWTVTALMQETGQGFTPYVLCLAGLVLSRGTRRRTGTCRNARGPRQNRGDEKAKHLNSVSVPWIVALGFETEHDEPVILR
jgi:hypothetical protein